MNFSTEKRKWKMESVEVQRDSWYNIDISEEK